MRTILAVSKDEVLLASRAAVLRKTNAEVIEANASEAKNILKAQQFNLVVLCHSLTPAETLEIASLAHQQTIAIPVLKVVSNAGFASEWRFIAPDAVTSCDPKALVEKVAELLDVSRSGFN
jgi:CheY-like chemotaxis protein